MPKMYDMHVAEPWHNHIKMGRKPVEGRKASPTWGGVAEGDIIRVIGGAGGADVVVAQVTGVTRYGPGPTTLRDYLAGETLARALPGVETFEEGAAIYLQWSTAEEIEGLGMLGIQLEVLAAAM